MPVCLMPPEPLHEAMAILVEALTLVVRRPTLDLHLPGGAHGWMDTHRDGTFAARWVVSDRELVGVSFLTDDLGPAVEALLDEGLLFMDEGRFIDLAVVDQEAGLGWECDWLEWIPSPGRFHGWCRALPGGEERRVAPPRWEPGGEGLIREDVRHESHLQPLGADPEGEHWLDTRSGRVMVFPPDVGHGEDGPGGYALVVSDWLKARAGTHVGPDHRGRTTGETPLASLRVRLTVEVRHGQALVLLTARLPLILSAGAEETLFEGLEDEHPFRVEPEGRQIIVFLAFHLGAGPETVLPALLDDLLEIAEGWTHVALHRWTTLVFGGGT